MLAGFVYFNVDGVKAKGSWHLVDDFLLVDDGWLQFVDDGSGTDHRWGTAVDLGDGGAGLVDHQGLEGLSGNDVVGVQSVGHQQGTEGGLSHNIGSHNIHQTLTDVRGQNILSQ